MTTARRHIRQAKVVRTNAPKASVQKQRAVKAVVATPVPPAAPSEKMAPAPQTNVQLAARQLFPENGKHNEMIESIKACFH